MIVGLEGDDASEAEVRAHFCVNLLRSTIEQ
jgi:hypothetical protein